MCNEVRTHTLSILTSKHRQALFLDLLKFAAREQVTTSSTTSYQTLLEAVLESIVTLGDSGVRGNETSLIGGENSD